MSLTRDFRFKLIIFERGSLLSKQAAKEAPPLRCRFIAKVSTEYPYSGPSGISISFAFRYNRSKS